MERSGSSESSSGMDREGGWWRVAREDANDDSRGREGTEVSESLELKRESLAPAEVGPADA